MKKVLLIMPSFYSDYERKAAYKWIAPNGLGYIASAIRDICDVRILDVMGRDELIDKTIAEFAPDIIGVSCLTTFYPEFSRVVRHIREALHFKGLLVAGGPHISIEPHKTLRQLPLDACIIGEGELAMRELVLTGSLKTPGVLSAEGYIPREPMKNLDSISWPAYDLYELDKYFSPRQMLIPMRGCPYNCTYCSSRHIWGARVRSRTPQNLVQEMQFLKDKYGFCEFYMGADTFVANKVWVKQFADLAEGKGFSYACTGRLNVMTDELFADLKRSGCAHIDYGVESAVQRILNTIEKNTTAADMEKVIRRTVDHGFKVHLYFMLSLPGETIADMKETIELARRLYHRYDCEVEFQMTRLYPGTPMAATAKLEVEDWAKTIYPGLRYPNVPLYLEYPYETIHKLWVDACTELMRSEPSPNPLVRAWRRMRYIANRILYARSPGAVAKKIMNQFH